MWKSVLVLVLVAVTLPLRNGHRHGYEIFKEEEDRDTLLLTHVVFRHGDRTPDVSSIYPGDPYINETYYPFGKGQLTLQGKQRAYALGDSLRRRYGWFLGDTYFPDLLEGRSSAYPRTQMTLQSVQTALFPPTMNYEIKEKLPWQPIPYLYSDFANDKLIATFQSCPRMFDIADELEKTEPYQQVLRKFRKIYQYLSNNSGWEVNNTRLAFFIQNTLKTEEEWGFPLPAWTEKVWPEPLKLASSMFWRVMSSTVELRRLSIGNLLKKIVDDSLQKVNGTLTPEARKMFLYSGHDFTVVPILAALGKYDGSHLPYTAHVIFELHNINNVYGFKIYFQDYSSREPQLLDLEYCGTFCPIGDFVEMIMDHFPGENWCS